MNTETASLPTVYCCLTALCLTVVIGLSGCSDAYYSTMEKMGKHKRDIMVDRVEDARDSQEEAQQQFTSALEQFNSVVKLEETDLKKAYDSLSEEYQRSVEVAEQVRDDIDRVESVAEALFSEWQDELEQYQSKDLRQSSEEQLMATRSRYKKMLSNMQQAEESMEPVLGLFKDNVLFLKHNLNAQAIGSLEAKYIDLKSRINVLIQKMNTAIESSNAFIADIK
jgi:ElaB/YqjD/DUF883 family membrane-anchored ribosome-binding protein